jgi:hypothetical protein
LLQRRAERHYVFSNSLKSFVNLPRVLCLGDMPTGDGITVTLVLPEESMRRLQRYRFSTVSALKWRMNFRDAKADRINAQAYRWISSMWSLRQLCASPNKDLGIHTGFDERSRPAMKPSGPTCLLGLLTVSLFRKGLVSIPLISVAGMVVPSSTRPLVDWQTG